MYTGAWEILGVNRRKIMVIPEEFWNENTPSLIVSPNCVLHRTNLLMMLWNYARSLVIENDAACPWTNLPFGKSNESLPHIPKHSLSSLKISFQFLQDCLRTGTDWTEKDKTWPNMARHDQTLGSGRVGSGPFHGQVLQVQNSEYPKERGKAGYQILQVFCTR